MPKSVRVSAPERAWPRMLSHSASTSRKPPSERVRLTISSAVYSGRPSAFSSVPPVTRPRARSLSAAAFRRFAVIPSARQSSGAGALPRRAKYM